MPAEGWYRDPWLVHEDRWFSAGQPTKLVRDRGVEGYDPPPAGPPKAELVEARHAEPRDGSDLRRADDGADEVFYNHAVYDRTAMIWAPADILAMTSRPLPAPPPTESEAWLEGTRPGRRAHWLRRAGTGRRSPDEPGDESTSGS